MYSLMSLESSFYVILNERPKPKFDAHINGILLNAQKEIMPIIFNRGKSLKDFESRFFFILPDESNSFPGKFRDKLSVIVNSSNPLFVVSKNVESLLKEIVPGQVEFFDLVIENRLMTDCEYKIVNVIKKIDYIDYEKSDLEFEFYDEEEPSGNILTTYSLVLKDSSFASNSEIFLLDRFNDTIIVIRENVKRAIQNRNLSGFIFCDIQDFCT